jgi:hypothetical protein
MGQEQKPFEIKRVFSDSMPDEAAYYIIGANAEIRRLQESNVVKQLTLANETCGKLSGMVEELRQQLADANAEIRRLQEENQQLQLQLNSQSDAAYLMNEELRNLNQQLADAPTWGEWQDATVENLESAGNGIYHVEHKNFYATRLVSKRDLELAIDIKQFRRLNYTPKPAREMEKTYRMGGRNYTLSEIAEKSHGTTAYDLARDLLAVQAELRELKGEIK